MKKHKTLGAAAVVAAATLFAGAAGAAELSEYTSEELYNPCHEGDNEARWGAVAETECEQYLRGFTDAYILIVEKGAGDGICLPDVNRDDEVRWAFMKWTVQNFSDRHRPAGEGVMETLREAFKCQ